MKRAYVLLLTLVLILTGCAGKEKTKNISVEDVCCPYEINYKKDVVEILLQDREQSGIIWRVETFPEYICQATQQTIDQEHAVCYCLTGKDEGVAQITFTAQLPNETICFVLDLVVDVDSEGKVAVSSYQHHERKDHIVEAEGLNYKWNVDTDGILNFSFINQEDNWNVRGDDTDAFDLSNMMSTPAGCKFSARAIAAGQATIVLTGKNTQRTIHVVIQADDQGKMEVISVQEQ